MPSKPFYSIDEVCQRLGKSQDEVKALVRDGTLREFRDAGKVFFKAEDIDKLGQAGAGPGEPPRPTEDTGEILLEPAEPEPKGDEDQDDLTHLSDTAGGTSIIGLEPIEEEESPAEKEKKEDTVITASGIGVFDDDELEIDADPMAKTQITDAATDDQVSLEGSGSGSGLLDLAREADDTALGADLLDEIYPGEEDVTEPAEPAAVAEAEPPTAVEAEAEAEAEAPEEEELAAAETGVAVVTMPRVAADPWEGMLSGLLVGGVIVMALATTVCAGLLQGFVPDFARWLADGTNFFIFLGGSVLLAVITLLIGWVLGRALGPRR